MPGPRIVFLAITAAVLWIASTAAGAATERPVALKLLHAQGRQIRDSAGKVVQLRGVNVGGWLVTEAWMCGQTDDGKRKALEQLEARFGVAKAATLMTAWQDNWMTASDLDAIATYGCNVLRVPFSYRTLQDAAGNWRRDARKQIDFTRMDWIVREAQARGMYVIFDLHIWPGDYEEISRPTPAGQAVRVKMAALWSEVAKHYKGVAAIAAFDVINEPEGSPGNVLQQAFYDAIRKQDPSRMLIVESVDYAGIAGHRWQNLVYSPHYPENSLKTGTARERLRAFDEKAKISATPKVQVPVFVGELKAPQDTAESAAELAAELNRLGWNWCVWTYKGVDNGGWASVNYDRSLKYDLSIDEYEAVMEKWTKGLQRPPHKNEWWIEGFSRGFKGEGAGKN